MAKKKARVLRKGDIIHYDTPGPDGVDEVIREVVIVLRMANGESLSVDPTDEFEIIEQDDFDPITDEDLVVDEEEPAITGGTE